MKLTQQDLEQTFNAARSTDAPFVFILVEAEGIKEVISIPQESFDAKEAFYKRAYNDELVHCMNSSVSIRGLSYGEAIELLSII